MRSVLIGLIVLFVAGYVYAAPLTMNYVPKNFAGGAVMVDSIIYSATNVGIGISAPTSKFSVDGTVYFKPSSLSSAAGGGSRLGINVDGTIYKY